MLDAEELELQKIVRQCVGTGATGNSNHGAICPVPRFLIFVFLILCKNVCVCDMYINTYRDTDIFMCVMGFLIV